MIPLLRSMALALAAVGSWSGNALGEDAVSAALGRIAYRDDPIAGEAICTGALVAPDLVLTAGHCVRGAVDHPQSIRFDFGWVDGKPSARWRGAQVILSGEEGLIADVALVRLEARFSHAPAATLPIGSPSVPSLTLQAFRREAPARPSAPRQCRALGVVDGLLALDCPAASGNSGAPLLQRTAEGWRVVGVMVAASGSGPVRSWAVVPPSWVAERASGGDARAAD